MTIKEAILKSLEDLKNMANKRQLYDFIMNLTFLKGDEKVKKYAPVYSVLEI